MFRDARLNTKLEEGKGREGIEGGMDKKRERRSWDGDRGWKREQRLVFYDLRAYMYVYIYM